MSEAENAQIQERKKRNREDLKMPRGLAPEGKKAYQVIRQFLSRKKMTQTGGCKAFYKPADWDKHEKPELGVEGAVLVVVFDGGDLASILNPAYERPDLMAALNDELRKAGFWFEHITHWWVLVYPLKKTVEQEKEEAHVVAGNS